MKPTAHFDPDFVAKPPPEHRRAQMWRLLLLLAIASGAALFLLSTTLTPPQVIAQNAGPVLAPISLTIPQADPSIPLGEFVPQPHDHFVIAASPAIDPQMVRRAPAEIDEAMVVTPRDLHTPTR